MLLKQMFCYVGRVVLILDNLFTTHNQIVELYLASVYLVLARFKLLALYHSLLPLFV